MWARGEELFAEVRLPEAAGGVAGFGVHPALLDAALHAAALAGQAGHDADLVLPFCWQGVSLHAAGASAVRARIAPTGPSAVSIELADGLGLPVLSVATMIVRPVNERQLRTALSGAGPDRLFEVVWLPAAASAAATSSYEVFESVAAGEDPVSATYQRTHRALAAVQSWLAERDSGVLVVATRGAMALPGEDVTDLAGAAVWGWRGRRRPNTPAGSCWSIPMRRWTIRRWRWHWPWASRRWCCGVGRPTPAGAPQPGGRRPAGAAG